MITMNVARAGLLLAAAYLSPLARALDLPKLKLMETPEATYIQVDRTGFLTTYLYGIAPNGRISGVSLVDSRPSSTPIGSYVNGSGFHLAGGLFQDISHPDTATSKSPVNQTQALKINARGQVVGWRAITDQPAPSEIGWVWYKGQFTDIQYLGPDVSGLSPAIQYSKITDVLSINAGGDLVGQVLWFDPAGEAATDWHAWMYRRGRFQLIDPPNSTNPYPWDINERGDVVGVYWGTSYPPQHGFLRKSDGTYEEIRVPANWPAGFATVPFGINSQGDIVGIYVDVPGHPDGFLLSQGQFTQIHVPGSLDTAVFGINESGVMVGSFKSADDLLIHGFIRIPTR